MVDRTGREIVAGDIALDIRGNSIVFIQGGQTATGRIRVVAGSHKTFSLMNHYLIKVPKEMAIEIVEKDREYHTEINYHTVSMQIRWDYALNRLQEM